MSIDSLHRPAAIQQHDSDEQVTNLLYLIWLSRPDLQSVFDIATVEGQAAYRGWARDSVKREYGIDPIFPGVLNGVEADPGRTPAQFRLVAGLKRLLSGTRSNVVASPGATLIGYAEGVLGMGEHVRMSAEALSRTSTRFGILDIDPGPHHKRVGSGGNFPMVTGNPYRANIFHVNADQMLHAYCQLGADFFRDRYNIGFWAWELSKCPVNWLPVIGMVDEIWAPSRFIQDCFTQVTDKPVTFMPLCVELPEFSKRPRSYFGLPEGHCLFLYTFDFLSYIDRKNPFAAIRAFKHAFPSRNEKVGLVLKIMKGDPVSTKWQEMIDLIDEDPRIYVINEIMSRNDVLALTDACDCFVSLHRSEGFGRGPAEAMYLGKPVIVTAYSGNMDFTRSGASLLVDYKLIPVQPGEYVFEESQVWAEVDEEDAARKMRKVFKDGPETRELAKMGQHVIRTEFSYGEVSRNMNTRLQALGLI
jgi:glycosyltransferase involved in cell wall biosynthesis